MEKWILPDRREFSSFVNKTIWKKGVDGQGRDSLLLPHQRFVALYLILCHRIAVCCCITVLRVRRARPSLSPSLLAADKKVVVSPPSLRKNFEQEVIKCGGNEFTSDRNWMLNERTK
jgi:hypothetical protein